MSSAEEAIEAAILGALEADAGVRALLGEPLRVLRRGSPAPAYPYLEIARHVSEPAAAAGVEASAHRVDLVVVGRSDDDLDGVRAIAAMRSALAGVLPAMTGWQCVLIAPAFSDTLNQGRGVWRAILRMRAVVEPV